MASHTENFGASLSAAAGEIEMLIEHYTANLLRAAFSLGFPDSEAEELVQATFVAYLDGRARFEKRSKILTYLFGILYNKAREAKRLQGRFSSIDTAVDQAFDEHFDAQEHWNEPSMQAMNEVEDQAQTREIGRLLQECLESLSAVMRMAFTLKEVEGLGTHDICQTLDVSETNLGVVLFRARNKLRDCLTGKGAVIV